VNCIVCGDEISDEQNDPRCLFCAMMIFLVATGVKEDA